MIKISVNKDILNCQLEEMAAHAGSIIFPMARLSTDEIDGKYFNHSHFSAQASIPGDFSCNPMFALLTRTDRNGKIEVQKSIRRKKCM